VHICYISIFFSFISDQTNITRRDNIHKYIPSQFKVLILCFIFTIYIYMYLSLSDFLINVLYFVVLYVLTDLNCVQINIYYSVSYGIMPKLQVCNLASRHRIVLRQNIINKTIILIL